MLTYDAVLPCTNNTSLIVADGNLIVSSKKSMVDTIRRLCKEQGKNLSRLEQECGLGGGTINKWDRNSPSVTKVIAVANALGVPVTTLLADELFAGSSPQFIRRTELLRRRNISFDELSKATGISVYRLRHYFSEDTLGDTDLLREYPKLARALGVSPQYLHCLTDIENDESDTDKRFCEWVVGNSEIRDYYYNRKMTEGQKEKPTPVSEDGLDAELVALIKRIPSDRMPEVERYLRFQAESEEKP